MDEVRWDRSPRLLTHLEVFLGRYRARCAGEGTKKYF